MLQKQEVVCPLGSFEGPPALLGAVKATLPARLCDATNPRRVSSQMGSGHGDR